MNKSDKTKTLVALLASLSFPLLIYSCDQTVIYNLTMRQIKQQEGKGAISFAYDILSGNDSMRDRIINYGRRRAAYTYLFENNLGFCPSCQYRR